MPLPEVYAAVASFKVGLAGREAALMAMMARRWIEVQDKLQSNIEKLAKQMAEIQATGGTVSEAMLWQEKRYQSLLAQVRREIGRYVQYADETTRAEQMKMGLLGQQQAGRALNQWGLAGTFDRLNPDAVRDMVGMTAGGTPLRELLIKAWPDAAEGMTRALINGMALGWNPRKTAKSMMEGVDQGLKRCIRVARTEQLRAYRTASMERYRETGFVAGYRRLAAKQERTCIACLIEDGRYYSLDESDEFEDHVNGRCALVPVLVGHEGDKPGVTSGQEWFEQLDDDAQQRIMGAEKWSAWKDGAFELDDMVKRTTDATWGTSVGVRSLGELIK